MAAVVAEDVQQRTKAYAMQVERKLLALDRELGSRYWLMAELIAEVGNKSLWQIRGFETEQDYREHLRISNGSWYEKKRLWVEWVKPALSQKIITRSHLDSLHSQNVKQLMRLGEKQRFSERWINKASTLKENELEAQIDHVSETGRDSDEELGRAESRVILKIPMSTGQRKHILTVLKRFQEKHQEDGLRDPDDLAGILEMFCADWESGN